MVGDREHSLFWHRLEGFSFSPLDLLQQTNIMPERNCLPHGSVEEGRGGGERDVQDTPFKGMPPSLGGGLGPTPESLQHLPK